MPFDGIGFKNTQLDLTIQKLQRGLARVERGYCGYSFHKRPGIFHREPRFCMSGALWFGDDGKWEYAMSIAEFDAALRAEELLIRHTGGRSLVHFGTRRGFIVRREVRIAYRAALADAMQERAAMEGRWT